MKGWVFPALHFTNNLPDNAEFLKFFIMRFLITLFFLIYFSFNSIYAQVLITTNYETDNAVITNPERGFMRYTETHANSSYSFLDTAVLKSYRGNGISLIYRIFYLENYTNSYLPQIFLNNIEQDFKALRKSGIKAIVRFAYTQRTTKPYGDAPLNIVLQHIAQLKPLLQEYADVILTLQAGFIGAWGEWYYTSNYSRSPGVMAEADWAARKSIIDAELNALPATRMIGLRTTEYKKKITGSNLPLNLTEAYQNTEKARLGFHNDCFLADATDEGTYIDTTIDKPYQAEDTKYSIIGGETCNPSTYAECSNSLYHGTYALDLPEPGL